MNNSVKLKIKGGAVLLSLGIVVVALGFGCGVGFQPIGLNNGSQDLSSISGGDEVLDNGNLTVISGKQTVATLYYEQALANMLSIAGVDQPSGATLDRFEEKVGAFSDFGSADKLNAPKLLGLTSVGSEVCGDLMQSEFGVGQAQRRIFASVNFDSRTVNDAAVSDMVRRMARSFWQRNETPEELTLIQSAISEIAGMANDNNNTSGFRGNTYRRGALRTALAACAVMISSTSAIQI